MSRPPAKEPVVSCSKAAQRLAAIYRQHRPDQPALTLAPHLGKATRVEHQNGPAQQSNTVRTGVLDTPLPGTNSTATAGWLKTTGWQSSRDTHSELYVTCHTLCRLRRIHGTIVEVLLPYNMHSHTLLVTQCHRQAHKCRYWHYKTALALLIWPESLQ